MGYKKAAHILPQKLLEEVQEYVDGEFIYIPRASEKKRGWGTGTSTREELRERNMQIYRDFLSGMHTEALAEKYYLSLKSIQRIVGQQKKNIVETSREEPPH